MKLFRHFSMLLFAIAVALPALAQQGGASISNEARIQLLQLKPRAYAIVEASGRHQQSRVRLAALEAAEYAPDAAYDLARNGMTDENPAVRFAALVTVGKLRLKSLSDAAMDLMRDENASVRAAAIFAAKRCGKPVDLSPLGSMLGSSRASTRANAAMLIGQLGEPQALEMLREMASQPMPRVSPPERTWVRLQFAEAIIRLDPNDAEVLSTIRAAVYSNLDDVRVLAILILGEIGDKSVRGGLAHIAERPNPIQVKIAAAQALAMMGDRLAEQRLLEISRYSADKLRKDLKDYLDVLDEAYPSDQLQGPEVRAIRQLLDDPQAQIRAAAEVRAQAARGLGYVSSGASAKRLGEMMDERDPIVQAAAAAAVLRATR